MVQVLVVRTPWLLWYTFTSSVALLAYLYDANLHKLSFAEVGNIPSTSRIPLPAAVSSIMVPPYRGASSLAAVLAFLPE